MITRKKKQITPEQARRRLKIILVVFAAMLVFITYTNIRLKNNSQRFVDTILPVLDAQLDSIVRTDFPEGTKIITVGVYETIEEETSVEQEYRSILTRLELLKGSGNPSQTLLDELTKRAEEIAEEAARSEKKSYLYRHVTLEAPDGVRTAAYQRTPEGGGPGELVLRIDYTQEEMQEKNNYITDELENPKFKQ